MCKLVRTALATSAAALALAISLLVVRHFRPLPTDSYRQPPRYKHGEELPAQSDEHVVQGSHSNSDLPHERLLPDIDIQEVLRAGKRKALADRQQQLASHVSAESTGEKVRNLLYKTYCVGDPLLESAFTAAERYISTLQRDPRVSSLVDVAIHGTKSERRQLLDTLVAASRVYPIVA